MTRPDHPVFDAKNGATRRRGSTITMVLTAMPVIIGSVAMGVDWGQVAVARVQAQAAADEGALAAASALSDRPRTTATIAAAQSLGTIRATQYASGMQVNNIVPTVHSVTFGHYADGLWATTWPAGQGPNAVDVVAQATVETSFARIFGLNGVVVSARARAGASVIAKRAPDLVIVQDVTPSMRAADIAAAKAANSSLVDCIEEFATSDTRGAFVKFANVDRTIVPLVSYEQSPDTLFKAASGITSAAYTQDNACVSGTGGCTTHASGYYAAVDILNKATEPPEDVGQAIIFITDGAPYTGGKECTSTVYDSSGSTPYKTWLKSKCTAISAHSTQTACDNAGGVWKSSESPRCRAADNGAEATTYMTPGTCSKSGYTTEARCEGNNGIWRRASSTTPNPSLHTQWAEQVKAMASSGKWREIDVYAVFYSADATATYKNDNLKFIQNHIVRGKGAEVGVLDAPSGASLRAALEEICMAYASGGVGLIE